MYQRANPAIEWHRWDKHRTVVAVTAIDVGTPDYSPIGGIKTGLWLAVRRTIARTPISLDIVLKAFFVRHVGIVTPGC